VLEKSGLYQTSVVPKKTTETGVVSKIQSTLRNNKEMFPFLFVLDVFKRAQDDVEIVLNSMFPLEENEDKAD